MYVLKTCYGIIRSRHNDVGSDFVIIVQVGFLENEIIFRGVNFLLFIFAM